MVPGTFHLDIRLTLRDLAPIVAEFQQHAVRGGEVSPAHEYVHVLHFPQRGVTVHGADEVRALEHHDLDAVSAKRSRQARQLAEPEHVPHRGPLVAVAQS